MNTEPKNYCRNCKERIAQFLLVISIITPCILHAQQAPAIEWQKCLGGTHVDEAYRIIPTSDGGYACIGATLSTDGDVSGLHLDSTKKIIWFIKLSSSGAIEWQKLLGGSGGSDGARSIIQTSDSGFLIAGFTNSNDGDVSGLHIDTTTNKYVQSDAWIIKLSSSGDIEWQKCIGGTSRDEFFSVIETSDSGYVVAGEATSTNGDISVPHDGSFWVMKLSHVGDIQWQKCLGGTNGQEYAFSIIQTPDGGYVVAGNASSSNGDVKGQHGGPASNGNIGTDDVWVVKLSLIGKFLWQKCLGGSKNDGANSIVPTSDGGFVIAGATNSDDGDVIGYHHPDTTFRETDTVIVGKDNADAWIIKFDSLGTIEWQNCLGGLGDDIASAIIQTSDGGYVFTGSTNSTDGDVSGLHSRNTDAWLVKLNSLGKLLWQKCLGGIDDDDASSIVQSSDKGYVIAGRTMSKDGDASGIHEIKHGYYSDDAWIVKLSAPSSVEATTTSRGLNLSDYPNPATKIVHLGFDLPKSSPVDITISSVTGEQMQVIHQTEEHSGHHELNLDLSKFVSGTYFITVASAGVTETISVEVAR